MRRFSFKVDLRQAGALGQEARPAPQAPAVARDAYALSEALRPQRQGMRDWPRFQQQLSALPQVRGAAGHFEDPELAQEYVRIYGVTRQKILDAAPGFATEGKTEVHCFFDQDGSKHLVSRLIALPNTRVTELSMYPSGEVTRLYYQNAGGPEQDLDELYERGLAGLEEEVGRFARYPHYLLKFVLLPCEHDLLADIYRGTCYYDPDSGTVATEEEG
jgi:hypothetical protein